MSRTQTLADATGVLCRVPNVGAVIEAGPTVPSSGAVGFAPGSFWIDTDASGISSWYQNVGTFASANFVLKTFPLTDLSTLVTTVTELNLLSGLLATAAEINRNNKPSTRGVASGAALTITQALHDGKTIILAAAAAITLPAMTGSFSRYRFVLPQDATAVTITATGAHLFGALDQNNDTGQGTGFQLPAINAGGATVITLDGTTKGGRKGDWIEIEDIASNVGTIRGQLNASGTEASPFS